LSSAVYFLRVTRRMVRIVTSAEGFPLFFLAIVPPAGDNYG
jgi:hypothetical protein